MYEIPAIVMFKLYLSYISTKEIYRGGVDEAVSDFFQKDDIQVAV